MKKIVLSSSLSLLVSANLFASENFIELGMGVMNSKDNFSTESKSNISTTNQEAKSETEAIPMLSFYYGHELDSDNTIYAAMEMGDLHLGYETSTDIGLFDVGFIYAFPHKAWENPFQTVGNRKKTDVTEMGGYLRYGMMFNEQWQSSLTYQLTTVDYDKETVANALKQEGTRHVLSFENEIGSYMANLHYELYDADGKQSAYKQYELEVGKFFELTSRTSLVALANVGTKQYDETNTVLNKKIDATTYGIMASLRYERPFEFKNSYVSFKTGIKNEDANHNFYDKENQFAMVSFGYKF